MNSYKPTRCRSNHQCDEIFYSVVILPLLILLDIGSIVYLIFGTGTAFKIASCSLAVISTVLFVLCIQTWAKDEAYYNKLDSERSPY